MATMRELNGKINEAREAIMDARHLADCLTVDPGEKDGEIRLLQATLKGQARKLDFYREIVDKLRKSRLATREALGAASLERTADAAKRVVESANSNRFGPVSSRCREILSATYLETLAEASQRVVQERDSLREQLRLSRANAAKLALSAPGIGVKDKRNVAALRKAREEVRKILGAKKGESTKDAARRATRVGGEVPWKSMAYDEMNVWAKDAGFEENSVTTYVRDLRYKNTHRGPGKKAK